MAIEIIPRIVVIDVSMIGCILDTADSTSTLTPPIHLAILELIAERRTIASFTATPVKAIKPIQNVRENGLSVI